MTTATKHTHTHNHRYAHNSSCQWMSSCAYVRAIVRTFIVYKWVLRYADEQRERESDPIDSIQQVIEKWIVYIVIEFDRFARVNQQRLTMRREQLAARRMPSTKPNQHNSWEHKRGIESLVSSATSNWMTKTERTTTLMSFFGQFLDLLVEFWWCVYVALPICPGYIWYFEHLSSFLRFACAFCSAVPNQLSKLNSIVSMSHWLPSKCIQNDLSYDDDFNTRKLQNNDTRCSTLYHIYIPMDLTFFLIRFAHWNALLKWCKFILMIWSSHIIWMQ